MEAELGRQQEDHQVEVGWGFGVQRQPPVVREYIRAPIVLDRSSVYEPIGYPGAITTDSGLQLQTELAHFLTIISKISASQPGAAHVFNHLMRSDQSKS